MPYKPWSSTTAAPPPPLDQPVWVDLEAFWGLPGDGIPGLEDPVPGGLMVATGHVPGLLNRWVRATDGRWFGRIDFKITDKYGAEVAEPDRYLTLRASRQSAK